MHIVFWMAHIWDHSNTSKTFFSGRVEFFHALPNMRLIDKHENILQEIFWDDAYLILDLGYQYVGNFHNNVTRISSVTMCVGMVDRHTLLPWPCQMMFDIYENHVILQSFNLSQRYDWKFSRTSAFRIVYLVFDFSLIIILP